MSQAGFAAFILLLCVSLAAAAEPAGLPPLKPVPKVDLQRYVGRWFEIARKENRFQKDCAGEVTAQYTLRDDGRIDVTNECSEADGDAKIATGVARIVEGPGENSVLEVRFAPSWLSFLPMVWGDYWVIDLAEDYSWAVVGEPKREYFWILSRSPVLDENVVRGILERAEAQGYEFSDLVRTRQRYPNNAS